MPAFVVVASSLWFVFVRPCCGDSYSFVMTVAKSLSDSVLPVYWLATVVSRGVGSVGSVTCLARRCDREFRWRDAT